RDGRTDQLGGKATISASQFGLNLEGPLDGKGSYMVSARRSYLDFIFKAAGFGFVPEYWDFFGKAAYRLGPNDRLNVIAIAALDNVKFFNDSDEKRYDNSRVLGSDQNQFVGGISWQHLFPSGYSTVSLGQSSVTFDYRQADSLLQPIFTNRSEERESSIRGDVVWQVSKHSEISFGLQAKLIGFESDMDLRPFWTNFGQQISVNAVYDTTAFKSALYAQYVRRFGPLQLIAGLRGDYFNLIEENVILSPRFSASYVLTGETILNLSAGRYHQAPSLIWLTARPENRRLRFIGVDQYIAGLEHQVRPDTKLSFEVYRKTFFDYPASLDRTFLVMANTGAGFGGSDDGYASFGVDRLTSAGTGEATGAEFFVQKKFSDVPGYGTLSVSYNVSRFKAADGIERPNSFDQTWIVNAGGGYIFDHHWEFSAKFRYATGRPYTPFGLLGAQSADRYNSARIPANHSLDIRVDRRWLFSAWTLITYIDIQNIYNRKPSAVPRYDPRTGTLDESNSIGILPSIGVSAEF
ncbi:MAG: TonB-dependent receptor, partial [Bacteroidota bacterium]